MNREDLTTKTQPSPYDLIPYPNMAYVQTHPDRLAAMASFWGVEHAPVANCRVLEVGCGNGANLIPMAYGFPESRFVGIDLAGDAIGVGVQVLEELGLDNIRLLHLDLMDFSSDMGQFDYIIAHGFYSWVPPQVRDKLFSLSSDLLTEKGIVFVSYNTYPGGHVRKMLREMMLYHVHNAPDPQSKINQSEAFLKFLVDAQSNPDEYGLILKKECERVTKFHSGHFFHDDLSDINEPVYFEQFITHAAHHGLQFLSEADYHTMLTDHFPEHTVRVLDSLGDNLLAREQYLDFLKCRRFRQTLLCRQGIHIDREGAEDRIKECLISAPIKALEPITTVDSQEVQEFAGDKGARLKTDHPLAKAAITYIGMVWPGIIDFNELVAGVGELLGSKTGENDRKLLLQVIQRSYRAGLIILHETRFNFSTLPGERPVASALARLQAKKGDMVTNLRHMQVHLKDESTRSLLSLLDGTRDLAALHKELEALFSDMTELEKVLHDIGRLALLVS